MKIVSFNSVANIFAAVFAVGGVGLSPWAMATTDNKPVTIDNFVRAESNVTPKFSWGLRTEAFALKFDDWDGIYTDAQLAMEYRAFKNVGLGIGLNSNSLKVTEDTSEHKFIF